MKNNIIKASEEVFPIDKEMSLDEQCDQFLRQIGFKFGANWAIERACEWLLEHTSCCSHEIDRFRKSIEEGGEK